MDRAGTSAGRFRTPGIVRRARLLRAARELLATRDLDTLSLADVAARARIPKGSAYHYYADISDLYAQLLAEIDEAMYRQLRQPLSGVRIRAWQDVIAALVRRGVRYFAGDPAARQLILSSKAPPDLKLRDRQSDVRLGTVFATHLAAHFEVPANARSNAVFFRAVEIADLMFSLSVLDHGRITGEMSAEAVRAVCAYLGTHLPASLPRRPAARPAGRAPAR